MHLLKDLRGVREAALANPDPREYALLQAVEDILTQSGFKDDFENMQAYLDGTKKFMEKASDIYSLLEDNKTMFILSNNPMLLWDIYYFFPLLYAINNLGRSVFRTTINTLINRMLNRGDVNRNIEVRQHLCLFSSIFNADARLGSMASSVACTITQAMFATSNKKVIITAETSFNNREEAVRDVAYRMETIYSHEFCSSVQQQAHLIFIPEAFEVNSSWL